jgi:uncharacterized protein HemX
MEPQVLMPKRTSSMLAWILFALALVLGAGGIFIEKQKADTEALRATRARDAEEKARLEVAARDAAKRALETRVQELQAENGRLSVKVAAKSDATGKHAGKARKHKRQKRS